MSEHKKKLLGGKKFNLLVSETGTLPLKVITEYKLTKK